MSEAVHFTRIEVRQMPVSRVADWRSIVRPGRERDLRSKCFRQDDAGQSHASGCYERDDKGIMRIGQSRISRGGHAARPSIPFRHVECTAGHEQAVPLAGP